MYIHKHILCLLSIFTTISCASLTNVYKGNWHYFSLNSSKIVVSFPTGKIWKGCKEIWVQDIGEYMSEPWNLLDFSILATFMASFIARLMAFWHAYSAQCYIDKHYSDLANMTLPFEIQYFQLGKM